LREIVRELEVKVGILDSRVKGYEKKYRKERQAKK
jgi:hypothetical protein